MLIYILIVVTVAIWAQEENETTPFKSEERKAC